MFIRKKLHMIRCEIISLRTNTINNFNNSLKIKVYVNTKNCFVTTEHTNAHECHIIYSNL